MIDDDPAVELPLRWQVDVAETTSARIAPILGDRGVVVRCQQRVACLDRRDGATIWQLDLPRPAGYGRVFVRIGALIVTDVSAQDRDSVLWAIDDNGGVVWRSSVPGRLGDDGVTMHSESVYALATSRPKQDQLIRLDPATGRVEAEIPLNLGLRQVLGTSHGLIGRRTWAEADEPGWYAVTASGAVESLADGACLSMGTSAKAGVIAGVIRGANDVLTLQVRDTISHELRWSLEVAAEGCGMGGDHVIAMVAAQRGIAPVLLDAGTGQRYWLGAPIDYGDEVVRVTFAGRTAFIKGGETTPLLRLSDGAVLSDCFTLGPPAVENGYAYFVVEDGAICASLPELDDGDSAAAASRG